MLQQLWNGAALLPTVTKFAPVLLMKISNSGVCTYQLICFNILHARICLLRLQKTSLGAEMMPICQSDLGFLNICSLRSISPRQLSTFCIWTPLFTRGAKSAGTGVYCLIFSADYRAVHSQSGLCSVCFSFKLVIVVLPGVFPVTVFPKRSFLPLFLR